MKIPAMIMAELRRLTSTKMAILALVALMAVPILYGGLYLWANQDPYGKFSEVPVGLVVDDEGVAASGDTDSATSSRLMVGTWPAGADRPEEGTGSPGLRRAMTVTSPSGGAGT